MKSPANSVTTDASSARYKTSSNKEKAEAAMAKKLKGSLEQCVKEAEARAEEDGQQMLMLLDEICGEADKENTAPACNEEEASMDEAASDPPDSDDEDQEEEENQKKQEAGQGEADLEEQEEEEEEERRQIQKQKQKKKKNKKKQKSRWMEKATSQRREVTKARRRRNRRRNQRRMTRSRTRTRVPMTQR